MKVTRGGLHHAWVVLGALVVVMLLGSGLRAVFGVFIKPMEATFGWDRAALAGAAAISLLLLGAAGPIVGCLADQWGPRRVIFVSAILLGLGAMLSSRVSAL
ncbi:MAG TPA: MFS transporter, partial [Candidatus Dormibacteraeota bacterium]|nr:MFS transporter [Candidatus Dormibacteraeota bacterium]